RLPLTRPRTLPSLARSAAYASAASSSRRAGQTGAGEPCTSGSSTAASETTCPGLPVWKHASGRSSRTRRSSSSSPAAACSKSAAMAARSSRRSAPAGTRPGTRSATRSVDRVAEPAHRSASEAMHRPIRRIALNTGGGDAPGLNAVIRAAVLAAVHRGWEVFGIRKGYGGLLGEDAIVRLDQESVRGITHLGGTILGTTNRGNPFEWPLDTPDGITVQDRSDEVL